MRKLLIAVAVAAVVAIAATALIANRNNETTSRVTSTTPGRYVALGDSVAAGVGLPNYSDASACNRTDQSYPKLLAKAEGYDLTDLACSGATIPAGIKGTQNVNNLDVRPQLDSMFEDERPDIVTLTIGANDIGWTRFVSCYTSACGTPAERQEFKALLATYEANLNSVLTDIQSKYGDSLPKVIVTDYYQVLPSSVVVDCQEMTDIDQTELNWVREVFTSLERTISDTVKNYPFVVYANIDFSGHELCTKDAWVQNLEDKAAYHPNEAGQSAIAKQIRAVLHSK